MTTDRKRAFSFLHLNERQAKPRKRGLTGIRGPYYTEAVNHAPAITFFLS